MGLAPGTADDGGLDLQWNYGLEPKKKREKKWVVLFSIFNIQYCENVNEVREEKKRFSYICNFVPVI